MFMEDWKRVLIAIIGAIAVWLFVHQSIVEQRIISGVPVRLVNLPSDKTAEGLLPNGILNRRISLTLSGTKDVVNRLEPSDLEVIVDASEKPNEWFLQVSKKNLYSLNPDVDLAHHIQNVSNNEYFIKLSRLVTDKIPVTIGAPRGQAPSGYEFLDIWPQDLMHTVTGPEERVRQLKERGFTLVFNLDQISRSQLDQLKSTETPSRKDEVHYLVPDRWKSVIVPFDSDIPELINDPRAAKLQVAFLRKEFKPLGTALPVRVFYPVDTLESLNPETYSLSADGHTLVEKDGVNLLGFPVLVAEVSQVFLDVVQNSLEIVITAVPKAEREYLDWSIELINQRELEDRFVARLMTEDRYAVVDQSKKETRLRRRFRRYMQNLNFYKQKGQRLLLQCRLEESSITVHDVSSAL